MAAALEKLGVSGPLQSVHLEHPNPRVIDRAVVILRAGGLICYPTDTQYAVGCDLHSKKGVERLFALKRPQKDKPLTLICADLAEVARYAQVTNFAYRTMRHLAPGPYTFILEATRLTPRLFDNR